MRKADIWRLESEDTGTFGEFVLDDGWKCHSGELPQRNNAQQKSCILAGTYICYINRSPKFGLVYHLLNVPGRTDILVHAANFVGDKDKGLRSEVKGCIALGLSVGELEGQQAILKSKAAIEQLEGRLHGERFLLTIHDPKELPMNSTDWLNIMSQVPNLVQSIEKTYPTSGSGVQKLGAVVGAIAPLVPPQTMANVLPALTGWIGAIVSLYNLVGFFKTSANAPATATVQQSDAGGS